MTLTLNCQGQLWNLLYLGQSGPIPIATRQNQIYRFNFMPEMTFGVELNQIWNLLDLSQRWFDCHNMKSMRIEWTEGLNDHQVWPWPWPWKVVCKIFRTMTGVTSNVGVRSNRLVDVKQATWLASKDSCATNIIFWNHNKDSIVPHVPSLIQYYPWIISIEISVCMKQFSILDNLYRHIQFHFMQKWDCFYIIIASMSITFANLW